MFLCETPYFPALITGVQYKTVDKNVSNYKTGGENLGLRRWERLGSVTMNPPTIPYVAEGRWAAFPLHF